LLPFLLVVSLDNTTDHNNTASRSYYYIIWLLVSSSVSELHMLIEFCELELMWLYLVINATKSTTVNLRLGPRFHKNRLVPRELGVYLPNARRLQCSYNSAKRSYTSEMQLLVKFAGMHLKKWFCSWLPVNVYLCQCKVGTDSCWVKKLKSSH
jgi:hypothetical protein